MHAREQAGYHVSELICVLLRTWMDRWMVGKVGMQSDTNHSIPWPSSPAPDAVTQGLEDDNVPSSIVGPRVYVMSGFLISDPRVRRSRKTVSGCYL